MWISLTEIDLASTLAGPEIEQIKVAALKNGQADCIQSALNEAIDEVRGYIAACPRNVLGEIGKIPERLKAVTLDIAAHRVLSRVLINPNEARKMRWEEANKKLRDVAACRLLVEDPTPATAPPAEASVGFPPPVVSPRNDC